MTHPPGWAAGTIDYPDLLGMFIFSAEEGYSLAVRGKSGGGVVVAIGQFGCLFGRQVQDHDARLGFPFITIDPGKGIGQAGSVRG